MVSGSQVRSIHRGSWLVFALCIAFAGPLARARVVFVAKPGPAGPAAELAAEEIAHWPTRQPVQILDHDPDSLPKDTTLVVQLTEDFDFHGLMPMANGAIIRVSAAATELEHAKKLAQSAADAMNAEIDEPAEQFQVLADTDANQAVPRIEIITSTKDEMNLQRISKRIRQQRLAARAILLGEKAIESGVSPDAIAAPAKPGVLRIAFFDDVGAINRTAGCNPVWVRQSMRGQKDFDVYLISAQDIRTGTLPGQFDVLIVGGGSSKTESATLGDTGRSAVQSYVRQGGGYVGICAGAFLAARNGVGLGLIPANARPSNAGGDIHMSVADPILQKTGFPSATIVAAFHGGPILSLADDAGKFSARVWATFTEDLRPGSIEADDVDNPADERPAAKRAAKHEPIPLKGAPSIISCTFGDGRAIILAPHCERVVSNQPLFWSAVRWAGTSLENAKTAQQPTGK